MFQQVKSCIASAQKKQKETYYDRKHQPGEIAGGMQVLLENTAPRTEKGWQVRACMARAIHYQLMQW